MSKLELEAEKYAISKEWSNNKPETWVQDIFIAGATSNAAKEYWYKRFEKQKLEFAIEQIKSLSTLRNSDYFYWTKEGIKVEQLKQKLQELSRSETTIKSDWNIRKCFEGLRSDKDFHLGMGDIRLTIGMQEEICELVERFYGGKEISILM